MAKKKKFKGVKKPKLVNTNGELKHQDTVIGALDVENKNGRIYPRDGMKKYFDNISDKEVISLRDIPPVKEPEPSNEDSPVISPNADYDMDILSGKPVFVPSIRGITTFLTKDEIESLHKGEFVASGDFSRGIELSKEDPFFFSVRGEPGGTIIANSKGSIRLPDVKIPLGSKFDYRY